MLSNSRNCAITEVGEEVMREESRSELRKNRQQTAENTGGRRSEIESSRIRTFDGIFTCVTAKL